MSLCRPHHEFYPITAVQSPVTVGSSRAFGSQKLPVHPARLLRSDKRRVRQTGYNIMSTGHEW
ncbi:unnamed protein product [Penicillium salamii]|nr:unnamed protein product [Penicillium salamii]